MITILFNGPPSSGKDTIGRLVAKKYNAPVIQFKDELYLDTAREFGVPIEDIIKLNNSRHFKDNAHYKLRGLSPRQALIYTSEKVMKPTHGKDYYGMQAARNVIKHNFAGESHVVFTDSGFIEELIPVADASRKCIVVRMHREGYDFSKDSRSYLLEEDLPPNCTVVDVYNNWSIESTFHNTLFKLNETMHGEKVS